MSRLGVREWLAVGRVFANGTLLRTDDGLHTCLNFEKELAAYTGVEQALAVSSGTAALICALQACGIGPGDEVLVPAYTWMASAGAVLLVGAVPVLVEVDETLSIDPLDLVAKLSPRSRAVIPVHMLNRPCDMERIIAIAHQYGLKVIEDACQAVGIRYKGRYCGSIGDIGTFSFNQHKNMTCGEGGAVLSNTGGLMARARNSHDMGIGFRTAGVPDPNAIFLGSNYRISEIQGAILRVQLKKLPRRLNKTRSRIAVLTDALRKSGYPIAPHNDPDEVAGLVLTFDTEAEAIKFAARRGARRIFDNSKHVYTEWGPILNRRMSHPGFSPWEWIGGSNGPAPDSCPKSLDLLRRSCAVNAMPDAPLPLVRYMARKLAA